MGRVISLLGMSFGVLSIVMLLKQGFDIGFTAPLEQIISLYQRILNLALGWADAPLLELFNTIRNYLDLDLKFHTHWKHIFVLMWLYTITDSKSCWALNKKHYAIFLLFWGGLISLVTSIATGAVPIQNTQQNLFVLIIPVAGLLIFELGKTTLSATFSLSTPSYNAQDKSWFQTFSYCLLNYTLPILLIGSAGVALGFWLKNSTLWTQYARLPLALLTLFIVILSIYWLARAVWLAWRDREQHENWKQRFNRSGSSHFGILMLSVISGAATFLMLNAGLSLAGL